MAVALAIKRLAAWIDQQADYDTVQRQFGLGTDRAVSLMMRHLESFSDAVGRITLSDLKVAVALSREDGRESQA
jgi:hypothetical protein